MSVDPYIVSATGEDTVRRIQDTLWARPRRLQPSQVLSLRAALRRLLEEAALPGVAGVRLLPRDRRASRTAKVFFVLETHDIKRDRKIIALMSQLEAVDYDLVPANRQGLIPDDARSV